MPRLIVTLSETHKKKLEKAAQKNGLSMAAIIRMALARWFNNGR